ncbi:MAG TPA: hypothetical protein VKP65_09640 [Rhodothermales bacterium]|nr:hypothetical protein [Rhodothermales bacterium]
MNIRSAIQGNAEWMRDDITVIIPAAGRVPESIMALSNITCPAMIPVAGRPVIYWTMSYLQALGLRRFIIAVAAHGLFIEDFVECTFGQAAEVEFFVPSRDGGLGRTMLELLNRVETPAALAVLGDTHFQFADSSVLERQDPFVLVQPVEESYRWCIAETDEAGVVQALHDKVPGLPEPLLALIGVYHFPDVHAAQEAAKQAVAACEPLSGRTEMAAILERLGTPLQAIRAGDWLDCGNPDRQASSHRTLLQKRAFNELSINPVLGTITKRSHHVEKFVNEINFLRLLPPDLSVLFPRMVEHSTDWEDPHLTMEYYGYPTLSEIFVFENVEPGIWEQVFEHLYQIVTGVLMRHHQPLAETTLTAMYVGKTQHRLQALADTDTEVLHALVRHDGPLVVNGKELHNMPTLWPEIEAAIMQMSQGVEGSIIHGDLCFSNILYDLRGRICKLIDPRGSFGQAGIYGDPRYDIAKLYHSVYGLYDFIINDLFEIKIDGLEITFDVRARPQHTDVLQRFEKVFFTTFDHREILVLTGLLFISMPALHYDHPRRQLAMYVRGVELLNEALSDYVNPELVAKTNAHLH